MCLHLRLAAHEVVSLVRFERDLRRSLQVQLPKIGGMTLRVTIFRNIADASKADFGGWWELSFLSGYALFLTHERILSQQRSRFLRNWRRWCCLHGSILSTLFIRLHRRLSYDGKFTWWHLCLFCSRWSLIQSRWRLFLRWLLLTSTLYFLWHLDGFWDVQRF